MCVYALLMVYTMHTHPPSPVRPTAVATPNFLEVDLGDSAEFKCVVVAFPAPTVEWVELSTGAVVDSQYTLSGTIPCCTIGENFTLYNNYTHSLMQLIYVSVAFLVHVVLNNDENNHTSEHYLRFLNVSSEFIGSYRCHAENSGGAADDNRVILNLIGMIN